MSDKGKPAKSDNDAETLEQKESTDPELDVCSKEFNPIKALLASKATVPYPNAPIYDNIAKFEAITTKMSNPSTVRILVKRMQSMIIFSFSLKHFCRANPIKLFKNRKCGKKVEKS